MIDKAFFISRSGLLLLLIGLLLARHPAPAVAQDQAVYRISLGEAARLAASRNTAVEAARYRVRQAEARVTQRRANLLPHVDSQVQEAGRTFNTVTFGIDFPSAPGEQPLFDPNGQIEGPVRTFDVRGRVSQPVFDLASWRHVGSAEAYARVSEAAVDAAAEQVAARAAMAYLAALRADAAYAARSADKDLAQELVEIARAQLKAGTGVELDVTRAEAQLAAVDAQLMAAQNARSQTRLDLLRILNMPLDATLQLTDSLASLPYPSMGAMDPDDAVALALDNRVDLEALKQRQMAVETEYDAIRAERLPTVAFVADGGFIGKEPANMLHTYDWGLQLNFPLFDGRRHKGEMEEQQALMREIDVQAQDQVNQIAYEIRKTLNDLTAAQQQVDAARTRLRLSEQEVTQARARFRTGIAGNAEVVTAMLNLSNARDMLVNALSAYQAARIELARAEGIITQLS